MHAIEAGLGQKLSQRATSGLLRQLPAHDSLIDFCSNDYLGLARSSPLSKRIQMRLAQQAPTHGAGSARLIAGNHPFTEALEKHLAHFHQAPAALLFGSGFAANQSIFSTLAGPEDTLLTDQLIHASTIEGVRLSKAQRLIFRHNDLDDLEAKLKQVKGKKGNLFIGVEALYSMDGDFAPLPEIVALANRYQAALIVDEAHTNGVIGPSGAGLVQALGLEKQVFARVHTFGKGLGTHGAVILGSPVLKQYLLNFARPFIYSTAPPLHQWISVQCAYEEMRQLDANRTQLQQLIRHFEKGAKKLPWQVVPGTSWIKSILIPENARVRAVAHYLQTEGFSVKPIVSPTVPAGMERIRICLHSYNQPAEIDALFRAFQQAAHTICKDTLSPASVQK